MHAGLLELILVFAGVLGLAVWDLVATKRSIAQEASAPEPVKPSLQRSKTSASRGKSAPSKPRAKRQKKMPEPT